jgi:hypothetical protein
LQESFLTGNYPALLSLSLDDAGPNAVDQAQAERETPDGNRFSPKSSGAGIRQQPIVVSTAF